MSYRIENSGVNTQYCTGIGQTSFTYTDQRNHVLVVPLKQSIKLGTILDGM